MKFAVAFKRLGIYYYECENNLIEEQMFYKDYIYGLDKIKK